MDFIECFQLEKACAASAAHAFFDFIVKDAEIPQAAEAWNIGFLL